MNKASFTESEIGAIADNLQSAGFYLQDWDSDRICLLASAILEALDSPDVPHCATCACE